MIRNVSFLSLVLLSIILLAFTACEEDTETPSGEGVQPTLTNPSLQYRGTPQRFTVSMAVIVADDQRDGVIHYVAFKEKDHTGVPTPQELLDHRSAQTVEMNGADIRQFSVGADNDTKYYIHALLKIGDEVSGVVSLEAKTEP